MKIITEKDKRNDVIYNNIQSLNEQNFTLKTYNNNKQKKTNYLQLREIRADKTV